MKRKNGNSRPSEIARLDFHSWTGEVIDRTRSKTTEKNKGVLMIEKIKDNFGITDEDIRGIRTEVLKEEKEEQGKIFQNKPIQWKRDANGNII